jgi:hypothetical protein
MNELRKARGEALIAQAHELRQAGWRCKIGSTAREVKFNDAAKLRREGLSLLDRAEHWDNYLNGRGK